MTSYSSNADQPHFWDNPPPVAVTIIADTTGETEPIRVELKAIVKYINTPVPKLFAAGLNILTCASEVLPLRRCSSPLVG